MNQVSLEHALLQLGEPPYSAATISEFWQLASSRETPCAAAELTRLEHLAGAIASGHADAALDLAARLVSARGDCGCWLRAALLEACGHFEEAAEALRFLREKVAGEQRALVMLASARNLFAAGHPDQAWHPLAEACKSSAAPRTLRNAARLLAQARKNAAPPFRRSCRIALLSGTTIDFLAPILQAQCFGAGIDAEIYIGPFNQYEQEIRQPDSDLARFRPDVIVIATDWRSLGLRGAASAPNLLIVRIQPEEGISLKFLSKRPGTGMTLRPVSMDFNYGSSFGERSPSAYETLLLDAIIGGATPYHQPQH